MEVTAHEVPAIEVGRTQVGSSEGARAPSMKEEAKEDESLSGHLVEAAKVTREWVEVSLLLRSLSNRLVLVDVAL